MSEPVDLFEMMRTSRAMRRLKPDPVPMQLVQRLLEAAVTAPSGGNQQTWRFLVVTDPHIKQQVQHNYAKAFETVSKHYESSPPPPGMSEAQYRRQIDNVTHLTEHYHEAPVWIVGCVAHGGQPTVMSAASIFPAMQNVLLAARALGLGATFTCRHLMFRAEIDAIFGLPGDFSALAIIPIGYPEGRFGPVRRGPLAEVVFHDRWGTPFATSASPA